MDFVRRRDGAPRGPGSPQGARENVVSHPHAIALLTGNFWDGPYRVPSLRRVPRNALEPGWRDRARVLTGNLFQTPARGDK